MARTPKMIAPTKCTDLLHLFAIRPEDTRCFPVLVGDWMPHTLDERSGASGAEVCLRVENAENANSTHYG
jgi:hypothetical protein